MKRLFWRGLTLIGVLFATLILSVVIFGATGFSDKMLGSIINQELRETRVSLAQTIRDPEELEQVLKTREKELIAMHNLDKPWYYRLPNTAFRLLRLDLGEAKTIRSFSGSREISDIILERLPNTIIFMTTSFVIVTIIGITVGAWLVTKAGTLVDKFISFFAAVSSALPAWWVAILAILVFAVNLQWLPGGGMYSTPPPIGTLPRLLDLAKHAVLPVGSLVLASLGPYLYSVRSMILNTAQEDFVLFARARGFSENRIRWRYILRVAAPPLSTDVVLGLMGSFGGAILTETVFNWPGMGRLYYEAVLGTPDEGLIIALTFIYTLLFVLALFVLEILYVLLDPRIRSQARGG